MPWTSDTQRFVVPNGMTAVEAEIVRRQLQIMARLDTILDMVRTNQNINNRHGEVLRQQGIAIEEILQAAQHFEEAILERVVGDNGSN